MITRGELEMDIAATVDCMLPARWVLGLLVWAIVITCLIGVVLIVVGWIAGWIAGDNAE